MVSQLCQILVTLVLLGLIQAHRFLDSFAYGAGASILRQPRVDAVLVEHVQAAGRSDVLAVLKVRLANDTLEENISVVVSLSNFELGHRHIYEL